MIFVNLLIVAAASGAQAYNWDISPPIPQQCATTTVTVTNDSVLPLDLLLIPYGPLPLSDASKTIYEIPLNGPNPYSIDFQMKYPAGTQLVYLVSDGSAWGWWGVNGHNQGITIAPNPKDNSPCWDSPTPKLPFTFSMYPNRLAQCEQTRIYWNPGEIQGNPNFLAVIVNGGWFVIVPDITSDVPGYGRGFIWRPPIRVGASVVIIAGDTRGNATGGAMVTKVGPGTLFTNLTGDPLIGQCPPTNGTELTYPAVRDSSTLSTGAIIGIVLAVISVLVALAIFLFVKRRRQLGRRQNIVPTVTENKRDEGAVNYGQGLPGGLGRQPAYYLPEPMTSPINNPAMQAPLYYNLEPFPDRGITVMDTPSTGRGEVVMQPTTHSGIYDTGLGTGTDGLQRPWSATGSGMSGDTVAMSVASNSPSPTGGFFRTQAYSAGVNDGSAGRM